jgi:hypothetical protein
MKGSVPCAWASIHSLAIWCRLRFTTPRTVAGDYYAGTPVVLARMINLQTVPSVCSAAQYQRQAWKAEHIEPGVNGLPG